MSDNLKDKSVKAFFWVVVDKLGSSTSNFLITIILARLLSPAEFGLLAMVMIFFELASTFIQSGFSFALIREEEISEVDKSTTFIFNLVVAVGCYGLLFAAAPTIANFFSQPMLSSIVRVMGLMLIINALGAIQQTILTHKIDFKSQTKIRFIGVVLSGAIAIVMAYYGWGVWALVAKLLLNEFFSTVLLWVYNSWQLSLVFSWTSFRKLFGFGSRLLAEALIDKFFRQIVQVLIGKFFSVVTLGYYAQANSFANMAANNFQQAIQKITYPILSKLKSDLIRLKEGYRQVIKMSSFFIVPVMILMGVLAGPLLVVTVGEKWLPATLFLQLLCAAGVTYHLNSINLDLLLVLGRVDLCLRIEIVKKLITGILIVIGIQFGIIGLVISQVISYYIAIVINSYYTKKFLDYPIGEQLRDVTSSLVFAVIAGLTVALVQITMDLPPLAMLLTGSIGGGGIYLLLHWIFKSDEFRLLLEDLMPRAYKMILKS